MHKNLGQNLWRESKKIIPGGNQLLSKRTEMFLPELWPAYYKKAKGCEIWDLDGIHYYDFAQMGVGTCSLGYADEDISQAVIHRIEMGSMSTLNSPEEPELAKVLIDLHPWADMARFSRTGGEACSIAIRIARSATIKKAVAFCGYHGWHDWYLSANLSNQEALTNQLLPGLDPGGVPKQLKGTSAVFQYGDINSLEKVIRENKDIGIIMMEPVRSKEDVTFLKEVKRLANKNNLILIFDEVTSGFRKNLGGIHLIYDVEPDIAVFGKALGNGHPISAIIGNKKVMSHAEGSFISSTYWTEGVGYIAALETISKMKRIDAPSILIRNGARINDIWKNCAAEARLNVSISGIEPLTHLHFDYENASEIQTFYTQEMLEKGFLVGAAVYSTVAYTGEILSKYEKATLQVFKEIAENISQIHEQLRGAVKHSGFKRLN